MKATMMYKAGDVRVETAPEPTIEQPTDAIIRTVRACICGSDLHPYHGLPEIPGGNPMGHEAIGVVEAVGSGVSRIEVGDFVVVPFAYSDNTCPICEDGFQTACPHGGFYGNPGDRSALQAEYALIPQADGSLVKVPDVDPGEASDELLADLLTLSDVYLTGYHAAYMAQIRPGQSVTVVGDGAVGLSAVLAAKRMGAEQIILMGRHESRTALGREWGATDVVSARGDEGIAAVRELTGGLGTHAVLEAVGHMPAYTQSVGVVRPGGIVSRVGVPQYEEAPVGFMSLFGKNARLAGGPAPVRAYLEDAIQDVLNGEMHPGRVFDRVVGFDGVAEGYQAMDDRAALKVMIDPSR